MIVGEVDIAEMKRERKQYYKNELKCLFVGLPIIKKILVVLYCHSDYSNQLFQFDLVKRVLVDRRRDRIVLRHGVDVDEMTISQSSQCRLYKSCSTVSGLIWL